MESKQSNLTEQSGLETPKPEELAESLTAEVEDSNVEDHKPVKPDALYVLTGENLRTLIDGESKSKSSWLQQFSNNALVVVCVSLLSGLIGVVLTQYYNYQLKNLEYSRGVQQQELGRRQSFSDEVSKLRIQKFGEVWEQLDEHEFAIDRLLDDLLFEEAGEDSNANNKRVDDIRKFIHDDQVTASRNRFWLGEDLYNKTIDYLDMNVKYALNKRMTSWKTDLSELIKKRKEAKQDILEIRRLFLEGEVGPEPKSLGK